MKDTNRIEKYWGTSQTTEEHFYCPTCGAEKSDAWEMDYTDSMGYVDICTCGMWIKNDDYIVKGGATVTVAEAWDEAIQINNEISFWDCHMVVNVNGVDMIATRGGEDYPSELL